MLSNPFHSAYRDAADECFTHLSGYIQELNANTDLYSRLRETTEDAKLMDSFTGMSLMSLR